LRKFLSQKSDVYCVLIYSSKLLSSMITGSSFHSVSKIPNCD